MACSSGPLAASIHPIIIHSYYLRLLPRRQALTSGQAHYLWLVNQGGGSCSRQGSEQECSKGQELQGNTSTKIASHYSSIIQYGSCLDYFEYI